MLASPARFWICLAAPGRPCGSFSDCYQAVSNLFENETPAGPFWLAPWIPRGKPRPFQQAPHAAEVKSANGLACDQGRDWSAIGRFSQPVYRA
jgi:hypothetical protein